MHGVTETEAMFALNPHTGIPIYRQLLDQIRRMVAGGQLAAGCELPSIRDLAMQHAVNPMTISKAYSLLEAEGLLVRHRGRPMTVAEQPTLQAHPAKRLRQLEPQLDQLVLAARQLQLSQGELIRALRSRWGKSDASARQRETA
jgi:GntR family transcriptional regulator